MTTCSVPKQQGSNGRCGRASTTTVWKQLYLGSPRRRCQHRACSIFVMYTFVYISIVRRRPSAKKRGGPKWLRMILGRKMVATQIMKLLSAFLDGPSIL